jgi:hypothetical protein
MLGNEGTGNLIVHSNVTGDPLFTDNTLINEEGWEDFVEILSPDQSKDTAVSLQIPAGYLGSGVKTGEIIFWAQSE